MTLSVIIPCRDEARHIESLLEALAAQDLPGFEIVVVDGASTDGTPEIVRRYARQHPELDLRLVPNPAGSIPAGVNRGVEAARGEVIARLDGHSRPAPDYLRRCVEALTRSGAQVVGGAWVVRPGGEGVVARAIALAVSSPLGAGDALYRLGSARQAQDVDTVPFGCFRRGTWEAVGGYNTRLPSNEDYEFNLRVRLRGGRVRFDPAIRCEYFARPTLAALARQYARYGWWKAQMLKAYPGSLRLRQALPLLWAGGGLALAALAPFVPWARAPALALWVFYLGALAAGAAPLALGTDLTGLRRPVRSAHLWIALMATFVVIHFSWGLAGWAGLLWRQSRR